MSSIAQRTGERVGGLIGSLLATPVTIPLWVWSRLNKGQAASPNSALIARLISATGEIHRLEAVLQEERDKQRTEDHDYKSALPAWRYIVCIKPRGVITKVQQYRFGHRVGCRNTKRPGAYRTDYKLFATAKEAEEWARGKGLTLLACQACGRYDQLPNAWKANRRQAALAHPGTITPAA